MARSSNQKFVLNRCSAKSTVPLQRNLYIYFRELFEEQLPFRDRAFPFPGTATISRYFQTLTIVMHRSAVAL